MQERIVARPILIIDSCGLGRRGLESLIRANQHQLDPNGLNIHTAATLDAVPRTFAPELLILIMRIWMVESLTFLEQLEGLFPDTKVVLGDCDLLSDDEIRRRVVKRCLDRGLRGYFSQQTSESKILDVLSTALQGHDVLLQNIRLGHVSPSGNRQGTDKSSLSKGFFKLSEREREVLVLLTENLSNTEIAEYLVIGRRTVESHKRKIHQKFGVKTAFPLINLELASLIKMLGNRKGLLENH